MIQISKLIDSYREWVAGESPWIESRSCCRASIRRCRRYTAMTLSIEWPFTATRVVPRNTLRPYFRGGEFYFFVKTKGGMENEKIRFKRASRNVS